MNADMILCPSLVTSKLIRNCPKTTIENLTAALSIFKVVMVSFQNFALIFT